MASFAHDRPPYRTSLLLAAILALAALVRLWGIGFGLPHTLARPDEERILAIGLRIAQGDLNPHSFSYPSLFLYAVALLYAVYFLTGRLTGWFGSMVDFVQQPLVHVSPFILMPRILSATAGVVTVWLVHRAARRLLGPTAAMVSAAFMAVAILHVRDSHFGVTDVAATCLAMLAFLLAARLAETGSRKDLFLAAIAAGLAASTKYNAAIIVLPGMFAALVLGPAQTLPLRLRTVNVVVFGTLAIAAFVAVSPYVVLDWRAFHSALVVESSHLRTGHGVDLGPGWLGHMRISFGAGLGYHYLVLGVAGWLRLTWRDWRRGLFLSIFPVAYFVVLGSGRSVFARYMLPVVPFLCMGAGFAAARVAEWMAGRLGKPTSAAAIAAGLTIALAASSAIRVVKMDMLLASEDSRLAASKWIEATFPEGASIGQSGPFYGHVQFAADKARDPGRYLRLKYDPKSNGFSQRGLPPILAPDVLILQDSPIPRYADTSPPPDALIQTRYLLGVTVEAFEPETPSHPRRYDWQDAFYLPLEGLESVKRPGPNLSIFIRSDLASHLQAAPGPGR